MASSRNPWESRFDTVFITVLWVTLAMAVFFENFREGWTRETAVAAATATTYVLASTVIPAKVLHRPVLSEAVPVVGTVLVMISVALTGITDSMYLLLSLTPVLFAAAFGGLRLGLATAGLSAGLLVVLTLGSEPEAVPLEDLLLWGVLYLMVAAAFSRARHVLVELRQQADQLASRSEDLGRQLDRLQKSYDLLTSLSKTAEGNELNPMAVGGTALDTISSHFSFEGAIVALAGGDGPIVVAKQGSDTGENFQTMVPLTVQDRQVGFVVLFTTDPVPADDRFELEEYLRPVALSFANILLLQDIAKRAVREERTRLARELHDEIGPSLASLGLALDLALLQHPTEPDLQSHLQELRGSVGTLVDEVRTTVADLRVTEPVSLTVLLQRLTTSLGVDGPEVDVQLDERRPPRPSLAEDLSGIVNEAFRNAVLHSGADKITVHGQVDFDRGEVTVHDDGRGFIRSRVPDGHFGLMGMEERAERLGGNLHITSTKAGTAVSITWGPD